MKEKQNTKDQIEQTALSLFSHKGYHAVSIRDICKEVGIKESSVYYHFRNKQAILDSLIDKVETIVAHMRDRFDAKFSGISNVPEEAMCDVAVDVLDSYLMHPYVYKVIAVLSIERMADPAADDNYRRLLFDLPLSQQTKVFAEMIKRGYIKGNDADLLAKEYQSVIYFAFQKNCIGCKANEDTIKIARQEIREGIKDLYRKMR